VLSFRPEKKEPRREGSKKTRRSASDGSPLPLSLLFSFSPHPSLKKKRKGKGCVPHRTAPLTISFKKSKN
ncbi:hypothetical protein, partial [Pseudodesulfovibrio indicus]|uniref:hypothetical protein n=1 Tax=Pseudodesulfovibrio indicus TaxID=1716143 RepID=UPI001AB03928